MAALDATVVENVAVRSAWSVPKRLKKDLGKPSVTRALAKRVAVKKPETAPMDDMAAFRAP